MICASPPLVVFGPRLNRTSAHHDLSEAERRFVLGRAAELCMPSRVIATGMPADAFGELIETIYRLFGDRRGQPTLSPEDDVFKTSLPIRVRMALMQLVPEHRLNASAYIEASQCVADRAGLLISGDLSAALRYRGGAVTESPVPRHFVEMILKPAYAHVRQKLGVNRVGGAQRD